MGLCGARRGPSFRSSADDSVLVFSPGLHNKRMTFIWRSVCVHAHRSETEHCVDGERERIVWMERERIVWTERERIVWMERERQQWAV